MKRPLYKLRMLIVGSALFMVPFLLLFILLSKAHELLKKIMSPVSEWLPINSVIGLETPWLFATLLLILLCLIFGLFAKTTKARNMVNWLETTLLSHLPGYSFMKTWKTSLPGILRPSSITPFLCDSMTTGKSLFSLSGFLVEKSLLMCLIRRDPGPVMYLLLRNNVFHSLTKQQLRQ